MMASFFQTNTVSTSGLGPLPSNTIAIPKGELKAITTRSGFVLDGPSVPMPHPFFNLEEDERVEETLTDPKLSEFTIKVPAPLIQKAKSSSQRNYMVHQRDPLNLNIPYPSRMHKQKQQDKDEIQIQKFWQMFKQLHINITLADALILILKYQKMLKALISNKKKLLELENTHPSMKIDHRLSSRSASINLIPLLIWKKLGLPKLISTCMTLELANREISTPVGIARDVFVLVGKFTFPADFVIVDYESDPRVPLILGRPFLWTARALIDVHGEEMILRDDLFATNHQRGNPTFSSHTDLTSLEVVNPLSGSTTSSSPNHLVEEFADDLALIIFPPRNDDLPFDIESNLGEIEYLLKHDPTKEMDSILEDSVDKDNLADPNDNLFDTIPEMFTDEDTLNYSSPPLYDDYDDLAEFGSDNDDACNDPFDSKEDKIKESKLFIDEVDLPRSSDFLPSPEYDSFLFEVFSEVDALPSTDNEDKVFNPAGIGHKVTWGVGGIDWYCSGVNRVYRKAVRVRVPLGGKASLEHSLFHRLETFYAQLHLPDIPGSMKLLGCLQYEARCILTVWWKK
nr:hypothetical protein [Tanacetum cinerariifolium]